MLLMKNEHVIQQLPTKTSEKPLHEGILPGRTVSTLHLLYPGIPQEFRYPFPVKPISIPMQITWALAKRCGLAQFLDNPIQRGTWGHRPVPDPTPPVFQDDKDIERAKFNGSQYGPVWDPNL